MDNLKSRIDKNILNSFFVSFIYLIFVFAITFTFDKKPVPITPKNTEYKLLYFIENYENVSEFTKVGEGVYGKGSFISDSIGNPISIPENTYRVNITDYCRFDSELNKFVYDPYVEYKTLSLEDLSAIAVNPQYSPNKLEIYKKPATTEPYIYDFVENTFTKINCYGDFDVKNKGLFKSPDNLVNFSPSSSTGFEDDGSEASKFKFPYIGYKNSYVTGDIRNDLLINGKFKSYEESGISLNPKHPYQRNMTFQIVPIGWVK